MLAKRFVSIKNRGGTSDCNSRALLSIKAPTKNGHFLKSFTIPKNVKGGALWALLTSNLLQNIKKLKGGRFGDIKKVSEKCLSAEKTQRRDPIVSSGFVSYVKNGKNERRTLCTNLEAFSFADPVVL